MHNNIKHFSPEFLESAKLSPFAMKAIHCIEHGMTPYAVIESLVKAIDDRDAEVLKSATLYPGGFIYGQESRQVYNIPADSKITFIIPKVFIVEAVRAGERVALSAHGTQEAAEEQVTYYHEHFFKFPYDFCEVKEMEVQK